MAWWSIGYEIISDSCVYTIPYSVCDGFIYVVILYGICHCQCVERRVIRHEKHLRFSHSIKSRHSQIEEFDCCSSYNSTSLRPPLLSSCKRGLSQPEIIQTGSYLACELFNSSNMQLLEYNLTRTWIHVAFSPLGTRR